VLFGTDVGYVADADPTEEYVLMQGAGLTYAQILAALTTAPAERFGVGQRTGRLVAGMDADIAVVDGDPAQDIRSLGRVRDTFRAGRLIYRQPGRHRHGRRPRRGRDPPRRRRSTRPLGASKGAHRSPRRRRRAGTLAIVKSSVLTPRVSSPQVTGVETDGMGRGRTE
jgi:adenine deaminase